MEREGFPRMNGNGGSEFYHISVGSSSPTRSLSTPPPPSAATGVAVNGGLKHIVHTVSKYDTLAGVAIKYGVEVADIKRLNGLVTDLQMFALKTIQIPLPGRHPPSAALSNGHTTPPRPSSSQHTGLSRRHSDFFDSFSSLKLKSSSEQRAASQAMSRLQGYYGLRPTEQKGETECEMTLYPKGRAHYLEDGPLSKSSIYNPPLSHYRKSKSENNCLESENASLINQDSSQDSESNSSAKWIDKLLRRRQKSEADFTTRTPEKLLKENISGTAISVIRGKGLALRPKSASRTVSAGLDGEAGGFNPITVGLGDSFLTEDTNVNGVRKSSSGSSLDSENGALSSIWPTSKWSLKPDFQALSAAASTIPIFDGLPKPSNRRNKAAVD